MPVGFRKSCWHYLMNYLVVNLWKSRFMKPNLGTFTGALSCAECDTPSHFSGNSLGLFLFCFKTLALAKDFL